jgi:FAD dependent oxidoreductase
LQSADGVTRKRDLRTGTPAWLHRGVPRMPIAPLTDNITADVAVVGAGVSGALVADALLQAGQTVVVLDRRGLSRGSTAASTALLQFELDQPLTLLIRKIGRERAVRGYWRSASAVDSLRGRIADLGLRCGFRERRTIYLPGNVLDASELEAEAEVRARVGLRSRFIGREELKALTGIDRPCAILSGGAGLARAPRNSPPDVTASADVTRQTTLPTSSATSSAPVRSTATPTGRPSASPFSARKPVRTSSGMPTGRPSRNGTKITLPPLGTERFQEPCWPTKAPPR